MAKILPCHDHPPQSLPSGRNPVVGYIFTSQPPLVWYICANSLPTSISHFPRISRGRMVCLAFLSKFWKLRLNSLTRVGSSTHFAKDPLNCYQRSLFSLLSSTINFRFYHYSLWILLPSLDLMITSSLAQQLVMHVTKAVVSIFCEN